LTIPIWIGLPAHPTTANDGMSLLDIIEPLNRRSAAEHVAERILRQIGAGTLRAGDKLPTEHELAAVMQVSRPVIREALRGLSILGVVESRQGGRCYVTDLTPARLVAPLQMVIPLDDDAVDALYEARIAIEGELLRLGTPQAGPAIARLERMVASGYEMAGDPVGFRIVDLEFHRALMGLAGNPFLERAAQSLYELGMEYRRVASEISGVVARSAAEHDAIVAALKRGEAEAAVEALRVHLGSIRRTTVEAMRIVGRNTPAGDTPGT